jgi:hypothetical protein
MVSASHGGAYPRSYVVSTICGDIRTISNGKLDMPDWGMQLMYVGRGWHSFPKRKFANDRILALAEHVETLQAN